MIPPPIHKRITRRSRRQHEMFTACRIPSGVLIIYNAVRDGPIMNIYSGKPDEGTGSSLWPGCAAALGSEASIDSSLPTSTFLSRSRGCFFNSCSSSRSGAARGAGGFPGLSVVVTFPLRSISGSTSVSGGAFHRLQNHCSTGGGLVSANVPGHDCQSDTLP